MVPIPLAMGKLGNLSSTMRENYAQNNKKKKKKQHRNN